MSGLTFSLTGDAELDRKFRSLPLRVEKKVLREGLREGAKVVQEAAKRAAPRLTGLMKSAIRVRAAKRSRRNKNLVTIRVVLGQDFFKGETFYGAFQEFGWKAGPRKKGSARPQIEGKHFIEDAYKTAGAAAKAVAQKLIAEGIEREAAAHA